MKLIDCHTHLHDFKETEPKNDVDCAYPKHCQFTIAPLNAEEPPAIRYRHHWNKK